MDCFYCSQAPVVTCRCSGNYFCAYHINDHCSILNRNHLLSGIGPKFEAFKAKLIRECISNNLKSIKERKSYIINETWSIISRITNLSSQALSIINEVEKVWKGYIHNANMPNLAQIISMNKPLSAAKQCDLREIETFYSQNFLSKPNFQKNWNCFLEKHSPSYYHLCLSCDSKYVFAGGQDHTVRMWNLSTKSMEHIFIGHLDQVFCVAATNKYLISGSFDRTIRIWNLADKSFHGVLNGHEKGINSLVAIENKAIISGSHDQSIRVWSIKSLSLQYSLYGHTSTVWDIIYIHKDRSIITCSNDKTIKIWSLPTRSEENSIQFEDSLVCMALSYDKNFIYSGSAIGNIFKYDLSSRKQIFSIKGHNYWINKIVLSSDSQKLFSCADDNCIRIWDLHGTLLATLIGHKSFVTGIGLTLDQKYLLSSSHDSTIKVWSCTKQCKKKKKSLKSIPINSTSLFICQSGQFISFGSKNNVIVWELLTHKNNILKGHKFKVWCTSISSDGKTVISGSADGTIRIWYIEKSFKNTIFEFKTNNLPCLALTSDNTTAVFGLADGEIKLYSLRGKNTIHDLGKHQAKVECVTVSEKNTYAISSSNRNIIVWNLKKKEIAYNFSLNNVSYLVSIYVTKDEKFILFNDFWSIKIFWNLERSSTVKDNITDLLEFYRSYGEFLSGFNFFMEIGSIFDTRKQ